MRRYIYLVWISISALVDSIWEAANGESLHYIETEIRSNCSVLFGSKDSSELQERKKTAGPASQPKNLFWILILFFLKLLNLKNKQISVQFFLGFYVVPFFGGCALKRQLNDLNTAECNFMIKYNLKLSLCYFYLLLGSVRSSVFISSQWMGVWDTWLTMRMLTKHILYYWVCEERKSIEINWFGWIYGHGYLVSDRS